jgi:hypothetical protein
MRSLADRGSWVVTVVMRVILDAVEAGVFTPVGYFRPE